ncbi:MAG: hypothetical protein GXP08_17990 [Gammaproteobacteria bacterium]|nr:hypothetical protein [Gammaproteobacteria bacterium]
MNQKKERAVEMFIIIMFPIALFVGCTSNDKTSLALSSENSHPGHEILFKINRLSDLSHTPHVQYAVYDPDNSGYSSEIKLTNGSTNKKRRR